MSERPFAVFDIDGTLIRWQLFHAVLDNFGKRGLVSQKDYDNVRQARMVWKKRADPNSFSRYEQCLVQVYDQAIVGLRPADLLEIVQTVFDEYKDQVYTYTRDLIQELKDKDYLLFAISGSQIEIVQLLANYYGFDGAAGSTYTQVSGRFTGQHSILRHERKVAALDNLVKKYGAKQADSFAIGDSEGDIPILEKVENAIAFNPTQKLFDHAKANNWQIVVERKNVVYKLEPKDAKYQLA